ncbi:MAG: ABC transporter ATP-binding protein [Aggregatilineales bacterium]
MPDNGIIQTDKLSKSYRKQPVLDTVSLSVDHHSICGFLGPNGAGKTTTIKLLLGLIKPSSGSATIFGKDIVRDSLAIRQRIGYLSQQPNYYGHMTARETLAFTIRFFSRDAVRKTDQRIDEALELVGLMDKADRPIKAFSGGERQRLGIAQAQINQPDLLILDEPAAALDPLGRRDVLDIMKRLRERTTIFYSTHILEDVQRVSDSVVILNGGKLIAQAPIHQLINSDKPIYSVTIRGNAPSVESRLRQQRWIDNVQLIQQNGVTSFDVTVNDQSAAEANMINTIIADGEATVSGFSRKQQQLEDIFIELTGEKSHA